MKRENARKAHLVVLDSSGNELWRKIIAKGGASSYCPITISDNKITVMTGIDDYKIYVFDKQGKLLEEKQGTLEQLEGCK